MGGRDLGDVQWVNLMENVSQARKIIEEDDDDRATILTHRETNSNTEPDKHPSKHQKTLRLRYDHDQDSKDKSNRRDDEGIPSAITISQKLRKESAKNCRI